VRGRRTFSAARPQSTFRRNGEGKPRGRKRGGKSDREDGVSRECERPPCAARLVDGSIAVATSAAAADADADAAAAPTGEGDVSNKSP